MARKKREVDSPTSDASVGWVEAETVELFTAENPLTLKTGETLGPVMVEYEAYGKLNAAKDNAVLVLHALSGDAHAAGWDKKIADTGRHWRADRPGWWDAMIGPGKPIDTNRFYVICSNFLGSCYGTTGPSSVNPQTGKPYACDFPVVMISDWVRVQAELMDHLGIDKLYAVVGGSLGGQQAIEWALAYPERVKKAIVLAAAPRLSAQGLAFNAVGRHSIMKDPQFQHGDYYDQKEGPDAGLATARMLAHITYLSEEAMDEKFGRRLQDKEKPDFHLGQEFQIESYLEYQGRTFVERFDANSYLYITRAMDYYDAAADWGGGNLDQACKRVKADVMVVSFSTDWLYPPDECEAFARALTRNGSPVTYVDVPSAYGHDAFLIQVDEVGHLLRHFLTARGRA